MFFDPDGELAAIDTFDAFEAAQAATQRKFAEAQSELTERLQRRINAESALWTVERTLDDLGKAIAAFDGIATTGTQDPELGQILRVDRNRALPGQTPPFWLSGAFDHLARELRGLQGQLSGLLEQRKAAANVAEANADAARAELAGFDDFNVYFD